MKPIALRLMLLAACACVKAFSQDIMLSEPLMAPLCTGPQLAGSAKNPRLNLLYRNQWPGYSPGFNSAFISYDHYYEKPHIGNGVCYSFASDTSGTTLHMLDFSGNYSWIIKGKEKEYRVSGKEPDRRIVAGIGLAALHGTIDKNRFLEIHPSAVMRTNFNAVDLSAGIGVIGSRFYAGISGQHLNYPNISPVKGEIKRLPAKISVIAASSPLVVPTNSSEAHVFFLVHYTRQGDSAAVNMGTGMIKGPVCWGIYYRNRDAFVLQAGLCFDRFRIAFAHDFTVSANHPVRTKGANEIGISIYPFGKTSDEEFPVFDFLAR